MRYNDAYAFLMQKLQQELPGYLTFHNSAHTKMVVDTVQQFATDEGLNQNEIELVATAALFHDSGFLEGYRNHEINSCKLARQYLPQFDYSNEQIDQVCKLIMATKLPHQPAGTLEKILCDADLIYLGSDEFKDASVKLFNELRSMRIIKSWKEWKKKEMQFLVAHHYFTKPAILKLTAKKAQNIQALMSENGLEMKRYKSLAYFLQELQDYVVISIGVLTAAFALKGFLVPNHFFDGGVTGISLLVHEFYHFDLSITTLVLNLPLIFVSFFIVGHKFSIKTLVSILLLAFCLYYIPYPFITSDKLLISIFGGIFLGTGSGLAMRAGCALDGIEVLALYTWRRTNFTISEIIMSMNIIIFSIAGFRFGIETALYSILTYMAATKTIDFVVEGIEAYTGVTIISESSEIIKNRLVNELGRSITVYKGERGFLPGNFHVSNQCDIIFTVITRLELRRLKNVVYETDPHAFVFANTIKEASGGIIKRRHIH